MVEVIDIELPWPPSANKYWRFWNRRVIISREAQNYKKTIKQLFYTWPRFNPEGPLYISIVAYPPDRRCRDLDNLLKITLDSLESAGMFINDSQIDKISIERGAAAKPGFLKVCVGHIYEG